MKIFQRAITTWVLGPFFSIELTAGERTVALDSVQQKYARALQRTVVYILLAIPAIIILDTSVLITVLIPITMVAGTAWFSISLANMKQKFEHFGLTLTANLFEAFAISLGLLLVLSVASLAQPFWGPLVGNIAADSMLGVVALVCGIVVIWNIVYKIFVGSIQYDINDAMLTGQNEAAERFYRRSLSLLYSVSDTLRSGKSLQVANYYIGVAFFEIFSYMKKVGVLNGKLEAVMNTSNRLVKQPSMPQEEADAIAVELIEVFVSYCRNPQGHETEKSLEAIADELGCLKNNNEAQEMNDTRFAIIFQEIASLLEGQGETLFIKE